jgi:lipopolysaccharide export system permease protein
MRILTRYVLFELLKVFSVALAGMTLFLLLVGLFKEAYNQGLGLKQIILLVPYVLPEALRFSVPATILFAACSVFGRFASANEVIAVKASGISPMVLLWPTYSLAVLLSLGAVWLNDVAVSWGRDGLMRVVIESVEDVAYTRLQQQHSYSSRQFSINVKEVEGRKLIRPEISFQSGDDPPANISCAEATMRTDLTEGTLTIVCRDGEIERGGIKALFYDRPWEQVIPLDDSNRKGHRSPSDLPMWMIPEDKAEQQSRINGLQEQMAATAAVELLTGDFTALAGPQWGHQQGQITEARQRLYRLEMEPARRWANGFSCLCFVLVGAPLAIYLRNADFLTSFFACFLPILIIYYPMLMFGVSQCKNGDYPPYAVWSGNLILAVIGIWLIRRVCRY